MSDEGNTKMHKLFNYAFLVLRGKERLRHKLLVFLFGKQAVFSIRQICHRDNKSVVYESKHSSN